MTPIQVKKETVRYIFLEIYCTPMRFNAVCPIINTETHLNLLQNIGNSCVHMTYKLHQNRMLNFEVFEKVQEFLGQPLYIDKQAYLPQTLNF